MFVEQKQKRQNISRTRNGDNIPEVLFIRTFYMYNVPTITTRFLSFPFIIHNEHDLNASNHREN